MRWIGNLIRKFYGQDQDWLDEISRVEPKGLVIVDPYIALGIEAVYFEDGVLNVRAVKEWDDDELVTIEPGTAYTVFGPDAVPVWSSVLKLPETISVRGPGADLELTLPVGIVIQ